MSNNNEIICMENPVTDLSCFSIKIPSQTYEKILLFGPVQRKDFKAAHGLMTEFAEAVWKEPCSMKTYSAEYRKKA